MKKIALIAAIIIVVVISFFYVQKKSAENKAVQEDLLTPSFREEGPDPVEVSAMILGKWQSTEDPKFSRSFSEELVIDSYAGVDDDPGTWSISESDDGVYVTLIFPKEGSLKFKVSDISNAHLELIYLDRGNTLSFKRAPEL